VVRLTPYVNVPMLPLFRVSQINPSTHSESLRHAPPTGLRSTGLTHTLLLVPSAFWQLPEQHSEFSVQLASRSAHVLHTPPLHKPEIAPGGGQHWELAVHEMPTGMHAEHTLFAQYEQPAGHCDEVVQFCPHTSAFMHTFTLVFWGFGLQMPERQSKSRVHVSIGLVIKHVPSVAAELGYLQVMPEQHLLVDEQAVLLHPAPVAVASVMAVESTGEEHAPYLSHARACIFICVFAEQPPGRSSQLNVVDSCQKPVVGASL
jgi:hypothetical protein